MYNFRDFSDYEVALFLKENGPFSSGEWRDIFDAIFRRGNYMTEFQNHVKALLVKTQGVRDQDVLDELTQDAMVWLMTFLQDNWDTFLSKMRSPEQLDFVSLIFKLHGMKKGLRSSRKYDRKETIMDDTYEDKDNEYVGSRYSSTDKDWDFNMSMEKFYRALNSTQARIFQFLSDGLTQREIARETGKSLGWVNKMKDDLTKLYKQYVLQEAREMFRRNLEEANRICRKRI